MQHPFAPSTPWRECKTILLWGLPEDTPLSMVQQALHRKGCKVAFIDQSEVLETEVSLIVGDTVHGWVRTPNQVIDLNKVTAAYLRPHESARLPLIERAGVGSAAWEHAMRIDDTLLLWADLTEALVINRPRAMASNNSKPYQSSLIRACGFATPETLITTSQEAVRIFWTQHQEIIYKSISGVRSIVSRLSHAHAPRLLHVASCPTQFQAYIAGTDYRVHVVGEEVFACKIISAASDYRYAVREGMCVSLFPYTLPQDIVQSCRDLSRALDLPVAGIDLRKGSDDIWYCFEVNPSPAFSYYQDMTDQPIDEAIAQLLLSTKTGL
ncbi:RimK domain-containing protein ATP-grasp [Nostoc sp. CENA67]|uniref:RimK domain-containing protein ATP-grasp n=1 Tax=Amazonocrinis nigriterrae CENA67 TaxID=2794033 RepID=A0A8J7L5V0_9NOST|nr:RimK domain-containing protein ATP-grasp [Amazonocrinis nigriterrae]MBH8561619.1 RimK domain-containing protein ATP-grasp [Amazonocrinis nigriterrae CENA67]